MVGRLKLEDLGTQDSHAKVFDFTEGTFNRHFVVGQPNSGKSVNIESAAEIAKSKGFLIIDMLDSGVGENLFWCVKGEPQIFYPTHNSEPYEIPASQYKILVIVPRYVELEGAGGSNPLVEYVQDTVPVEEMVKKAHDEDRILVLGHMFYHRAGGDNLKIFSKILNEVPELNINKFGLKIMFIIRETSLVGFSQRRIFHVNESLTKGALMGITKISRHFTIGLLQDTQLISDVAGSIHLLQDRLLIKRSTERMFMENYHWIWDKVEKNRLKILEAGHYSAASKKLAGRTFPSINRLRPDQFYAVFSNDDVILRRNPMPSFHHRRPAEYWTKFTGITPRYIESKTPTEMGQHANKLRMENVREFRIAYLMKILHDQEAQGLKHHNWKAAFEQFNAECEAKKMPDAVFKTLISAQMFYSRYKKASLPA